MSDPLAFLAGGGEAARMIRARDWSDHPLGPPEGWPPEFRSALSLVLNSPESMILAWGPELSFFFNDTYFPLLGPRLPWAMGARFDKVWADGWDQAKPIIDDAMAGRPKRFVDLPWTLDTDRGAAETWWTFSYSRVLDASGAIAGLFIFTNETTDRVLSDAALHASEERLREGEDHFRNTVELNPQVPWTCDPQGNIISYSKRWLELTGQKEGEPLGQGWIKVLHPDDLTSTTEHFSRSLASGELVDVDYRIRVAKTGDYRWMRARAYPRRDAAGAVIRWYGVVEDTHDRKLAEAALRENEAFLQRVLASSPDCIKVLDLDGKLTFMSEGGMRVLEVTDFAAVEGRPWPDFWPGAGNADAKAAVVAARSGGTSEFQGLAPTLSGTLKYWDVRVTPILGADGKPERLLAVSRDISEQRATQQALESSEARYRTLFDGMDEGFCVIEFLDGPHGPASDYIHVEANPAYARHAGISNVVGQKIRNMVPDEADGWVELYGRVLRTGEPIRFERELVATGRQLDIAAFRVEPASRRQVAVLFQDATEKVRARERYRLAIEATRVGIFDYNLVTGELAWDARVRELFGVAPDADVGYEATFLAGLHPDDRARADAAVQASLDPTGPGIFEIEYRVLAHDTGAERWLAARGQAVVADGRTVRFVGTVRDITAARTAEDTLRATEERLRLATRATNDAIWDWDLATNHVLWNESLETAYGHKPEAVEPTGDWWIAQIHPDDLARVDGSIHAVIDGAGTSWTDEYRFRRADDSFADVLDRGFVIRGPDGGARRMIGAMLDLTERKRAEATLRQLNETLEVRVFEALAERNILADIVEGTNAFVQVVDPDFRWLAINGAAAREFKRLFGVLPTVGDNMLDLLADRPEQQEAVRSVWARALVGEEFVEVAAFGDPEHNRRHYEMRFNTLRDAEGHLIGAYQFVYDVTERLAEQERLQQTEEALRQSQKMEAVGQLTGGLAHDFNNLLAGITGSLELMSSRMSQGRVKDIDKYMVAAQGAAKRAAALTHRLLAFSRRQTLDPRPTNVNGLINGMEDLIRRTVGPSVQIEVVGASGLWPALVDPPQLENALLNLCINARDAMPDGGRITIETANKWLDRRAARRHEVPEGQYLSLCVTDTGTGMPPDVIDKVFEPFFTTKPIGQGTGLGLSMIYGFAKQSGGQVRIYSEIGQGTTVCIYLPRHHGEAEADDALAETSVVPRALQGETVLVVDDEPTVRMLVTEVLEELGYTAIEAADSVAGLKVLQSDVRIDLLVTDVGLPGGMNGRQMADAGRERRRGLKVLFVTGYAENAIIGNGHLEPGMQVLTKPFAIDTLAARIRELVGS